MKVLFEIKTIKEQWEPPFKKDVTTNNFEVNEGESFFDIGGRREKIFKLLRSDSGRVLIEFSPLFSTKRVDERPKSRQLWINFGETKAFVALWSSRGVTHQLLPVKTAFESEPKTEAKAEIKEENGIIVAKEEKPAEVAIIETVEKTQPEPQTAQNLNTTEQIVATN